MNVYDYARYYEVAFGFRDFKKEVDFFEAAVRKFSGVKVGNVFELAAGPCSHLEEWHRRGYRYFGLEANRQMIAYSRQRAKDLNAELTLFHADMKRFALGSHQFDLAYVLVGSLFVRTNTEFLTHLDRVAKVLRRGKPLSPRRCRTLQYLFEIRRAMDDEAGRDNRANNLSPRTGGPAGADLCR